jgi:hypothetical protein
VRRSGDAKRKRTGALFTLIQPFSGKGMRVGRCAGVDPAHGRKAPDQPRADLFESFQDGGSGQTVEAAASIISGWERGNGEGSELRLAV